MKFKSRKSWGITLVLALSILACNMVWLDTTETSVVILITKILCSLVSLILMWIWLGTYYKIEGDYFFYRSGPISGKVPIAKIRKIEIDTTKWMGLKPALATKGMVLHHDGFNEIYISPKDEDAFLDKMCSINEQLLVMKFIEADDE